MTIMSYMVAVRCISLPLDPDQCLLEINLLEIACVCIDLFVFLNCIISRQVPFDFYLPAFFKIICSYDKKLHPLPSATFGIPD